MSDKDLHGHRQNGGVFIGSDQVPVKYFCKVWYNGLQYPEIVMLSELRYLGIEKPSQDGVCAGYIFGCSVNAAVGGLLPSGVSLVAVPDTNQTNLLTVNHNSLPSGKSKQGRFAVCIKGLHYPEDGSLKLLEWLEFV